MAEDVPVAAPPAPVSPQVFEPEPGKVGIRDASGEIYKLPSQLLPQAMADGARPATEAEYFGAATGKGGQAFAGLYGGVSGVLPGITDVGLVEGARAFGGDDTAEDIRHLVGLTREAFPHTVLGGEIAGAVAPAFFGVPPGAAGEMLAEGALARFGQRALAAAPRAMLEGGGYGMGAQLSDDTIQNHKLVAENYGAGAIRGGILGMLAGTAHAGLEGAGEHLGLFGRGAAREEAPLVRAEEKIEAPSERSKSLDWLEAQADRAAFKSTGATNREVGRMGTLEEERLGKVLRKDIGVGESVESMPTIAKKVDAKVAEVNANLEGLQKEFDQANVHRPDIHVIAGRFEDEVRQPLMTKLGGEASLPAAEKVLQDLESKAGERFVTFERMAKFNEELEQLGGGKAIKGLRDIARSEYEAAAERAAKDLGETKLTEYQTQRQLQQDLKTIQKYTSTRGAEPKTLVTHEELRNAVMGAVFGHPLGAVGSVASAAGRHFGPQVAAYTLNKATKLQAVQAAAAHVDEYLARRTKNFVEGTGAGKVRGSKIATAEEIRHIREQVRDPAVVQARIGAALGDLPKFAPRVAAELAATATRAANFMFAKLPKDPAPMGLQFRAEPAPMSMTTRLKVTHMLETIEDPTIVVDRLISGQLAPEHVETLEAVAPETYAKCQDYIRTHAAELRPQLTVQQEVLLSLLFKQPLSEMMQRGNIVALQASFSQGNQAPKPPTGPVPTNKPSFPVQQAGGTRATQFDQIEKGQ